MSKKTEGKGLAKYNRERKKIAEQRKRTLLVALKESDRHFVKELARILGISRRSADRLLQDNRAWLDFRKKSKQTLDTSAIKVMRTLLQVLEERGHRLAPSQMGILLGILYDKTFPASAQPIASLEIGSKKLTVIYPNWNVGRQGVEEGQVEDTLQERIKAHTEPLRGSKKPKKAEADWGEFEGQKV